MENQINLFAENSDAPEEERIYYVYVWYSDDDGIKPFYVGAGKNNRWRTKTGRNKGFTEYIKHHNCKSMIVWNHMTSDLALAVESALKKVLIEHGFPILDGEENMEMRKKWQREGYAAKKARGEWDDMGRPRKEIEDIDEYRKLIEAGETTVTAACKRLGISRTTWYERAKEVV